MPLLVCPKCRKPFSGATALGGGWLGASKVIGCPRCRTFFKRLPYLDILCVLFGLVNVPFTGPLMIYQGLLQDSNAKLLNGVLAIVIGCYLILGNRYLFRKNVRGGDAVYIPPWERT
jgi:hypothetical protein